MSNVETIGKWATIVVSVCGLVWGVVSFVNTQTIAARKPFLDLQLKLYQEATTTAAILATSDDADQRGVAEKRFWQLYWGELALVENGGVHSVEGGVEGAMKRFGDELKTRPANRARLAELSLQLAHGCRESLSSSWNVGDWKAPVYTVPKTN